MIFENKLFLGIDGGQSHTEAVIADLKGNILGIGFGGGINHGNSPDGHRKLKKAITESVSQVFAGAGFREVKKVNLAGVYCGLTGGADFKEEIIRQIIKAENLTIGHDARPALFGATGGNEGIVVIAGTGSIVFGLNEKGETARAGGLGFMFSDEGSGFWLAVETIKLAIKEQDGVIAGKGWQKLVLDYFQVGEIRELTNAFYNNQISRDQIASFAKKISEKAENGDERLRNLIKHGAECLVENVKGTAKKLDFINKFSVSTVGGMFRSDLMKRFFIEILHQKIPNAIFSEPIFPPVVGALLLAYRPSKIEINQQILSNLKTTYDSQNSAK